jgi:hypothetical protein
VAVFQKVLADVHLSKGVYIRTVGTCLVSASSILFPVGISIGTSWHLVFRSCVSSPAKLWSTDRTCSSKRKKGEKLRRNKGLSMVHACWGFKSHPLHFFPVLRNKTHSELHSISTSKGEYNFNYQASKKSICQDFDIKILPNSTEQGQKIHQLLNRN